MPDGLPAIPGRWATEAGLVSHPRHWPGPISLPGQLGQGWLREDKPADAFFGGREPQGVRERRRPSLLPGHAAVRLTVPPHFADMPPEAFRQRVAARTADRIAEVHARRRAAGKRRFLGARAVLAQEPRDSAGDTFPTFTRDPRIACKARAFFLVLLRGLRAFRDAYAVALARWRDGDRAVVFPPGTYLMGVVHGAAVEPPD